MTAFRGESQFIIEDNVLKGEEVFNNAEYASIGELVIRRMEDDPDLVGQVNAVTGEKNTYRKMRERSVRCALWIKSQGLHPGDVVALCSDDDLDFAMPCFAALYLGAIFNPWDSTLSAEDFCQRMNITKPKMVFASERLAAVVAEAARKAKCDVKIIVFGCAPGFFEFQSVIAKPGVDEVKHFVCYPLKSSSEVALILLSSGTTGLSKGVALSHEAIYMQFVQSKALGMDKKVCMSFTSVGWINGIYGLLWSVFLQIPHMMTPPFEEYSACSLIEKEKASWVFLTPTMINRLLQSNAIGRYDLSSVSKVVHSGAPLSAASNQALAKLLTNAEITSIYGLTEFSGYATAQSRKSPPGSCGRLLGNAQLKVIDPDTGRTLGVNQKGEVLLKSPYMMRSYHDNPEATAQAIDEDGWLHTGDLGYFDEDGEIFVIDRLQDIIRLADYDISPSEIESVILAHPGVKDVAVVGRPHPDGDDLPIAFVVRAEDSSDTDKQVTETEIVNLVASELPDSRQQLGAGVRFVDHIPRTPSNKIRRRELRDLARSMLTI